MKVQVITMVKDEDDIIEHFINYYGKLFGYENLYIVDNKSNDNTYNICLQYKNSHNINLYVEENYIEKGIIMKKIILENLHKNYDLFIPLDIDEFLVLFKDNKVLYGNDILNYLILLNNINKHTNTSNKVLGISYLYPLIESRNYKDAVKEMKYSGYPNPQNIKGVLLKNNLINENLLIDHGNHMWHYNKIDNDLCFIHYHARNFNQLKKKVVNNYTGLGYDNSSTEKIRETIEDNNKNGGTHHQESMLKIAENRFEMPFNHIIDHSNFYYIGDIIKYT